MLNIIICVMSVRGPSHLQVRMRVINAPNALRWFYALSVREKAYTISIVLGISATIAYLARCCTLRA
jgi:hypothetical protein